MNQTAALRAQWLAQISETIESAQQLAQQLEDCDKTSDQVRDLFGRLEAARAEVCFLQGPLMEPIHECDPDWLKLLGWHQPGSEPVD